MTRNAALALCVLLALGAPMALHGLQDLPFKGRVERVAVCAPITLAIQPTTSSAAKLSISGKCWGRLVGAENCRPSAATPAQGSAPGTAALHNLAAAHLPLLVLPPCPRCRQPGGSAGLTVEGWDALHLPRKGGNHRHTAAGCALERSTSSSGELTTAACCAASIGAACRCTVTRPQPPLPCLQLPLSCPKALGTLLWICLAVRQHGMHAMGALLPAPLLRMPACPSVAAAAACPSCIAAPPTPLLSHPLIFTSINSSFHPAVAGAIVGPGFAFSKLSVSLTGATRLSAGSKRDFSAKQVALSLSG